MNTLIIVNTFQCGIHDTQVVTKSQPLNKSDVTKEQNNGSYLAMKSLLLEKI